jgi:hypothetical protein
MTFDLGEHVRFARDYHLELPPEHEGVTYVPAGTTGQVVFRDTTFVVVELATTHERVPVWHPGAFSQSSATTDVLASETG